MVGVATPDAGGLQPVRFVWGDSLDSNGSLMELPQDIQFTSKLFSSECYLAITLSETTTFGIFCFHGMAGYYMSQTYEHVYQKFPRIVNPGTHCGIYGFNCPERAMAIEVCNSQGICDVPLYYTLGENAVEFVTDLSEISIAFFRESKIKSIAAVPKCTAHLKVILSFGDFASEMKTEAQKLGVSCFGWEEFPSIGKHDYKLPNKYKEDICTIMYSSGTTRDPKGVIHTNRTIFYCGLEFGVFTCNAVDKWNRGFGPVPFYSVFHTATDADHQLFLQTSPMNMLLLVLLVVSLVILIILLSNNWKNRKNKNSPWQVALTCRKHFRLIPYAARYFRRNNMSLQSTLFPERKKVCSFRELERVVVDICYCKSDLCRHGFWSDSYVRALLAIDHKLQIAAFVDWLSTAFVASTFMVSCFRANWFSPWWFCCWMLAISTLCALDPATLKAVSRRLAILGTLMALVTYQDGLTTMLSSLYPERFMVVFLSLYSMVLVASPIILMLLPMRRAVTCHGYDLCLWVLQGCMGVSLLGLTAAFAIWSSRFVVSSVAFSASVDAVLLYYGLEFRAFLCNAVDNWDRRFGYPVFIRLFGSTATDVDHQLLQTSRMNLLLLGVLVASLNWSTPVVILILLLSNKWRNRKNKNSRYFSTSKRRALLSKEKEDAMKSLGSAKVMHRRLLTFETLVASVISQALVSTNYALLSDIQTDGEHLLVVAFLCFNSMVFMASLIILLVPAATAMACHGQSICPRILGLHSGAALIVLTGDQHLHKSRMYLLLLGIPAATTTYLARLEPPGGLWQEDATDGAHHCRASDPILPTKYPNRYLPFFYCNATAFVVSLVILILFLSDICSTQQGIKYCAFQVAMTLDLLGLIGGAYAAGSCSSSESADPATHKEDPNRPMKNRNNPRGQAIWRVACAATHHMTGDQSLLLTGSYMPMHDGEAVFVTAAGNGEAAPLRACGSGSVRTESIVLDDVWFVPGLDSNLVSTGQLARQGCAVSLGPSGCSITRGGAMVGMARFTEANQFELDFLKVADDASSM